MSLLAPDHLEPLDAIVRAVDPTLRCDVLEGDGDDDELWVEVVVDDVASPVASDVELTRISTGATFQFADRGTPVEVRYFSR